jgi:anti-sigma factor RsiW
MLLRVRTMVCQQAVELMTEYLEGVLPRRARRRLEKHLADCAHCHEYLDQMRLMIELTGSVKQEDLEPAMLDDLTTLYRQWKADS